MNYLAHLYLADPQPLAWVGALMGDFLKGPLPENLPPELTRHLLLHRKQDSFSHKSQFFYRSCQRLNPVNRFGRGILVDVFYDHFLARDWEQYSSKTLAQFSTEVYRALTDHLELMPAKMQIVLKKMVEYDWLTSYRQESTVDTVLRRLESRLSYRLPLAGGYLELQQHREDLHQDFKGFLQEAEEYTQKWKTEHKITL